MIDHLGIPVSDPAKSRQFYDSALAALGYAVIMEVPKQFTGGRVVLGYGDSSKPDFWISEGPSAGRVHVALVAKTRQQVDDFYQRAMAAGGTDNGPPGLRPQYHPTYYGAFVLDPDGNNVEAVHHGP